MKPWQVIFMVFGMMTLAGLVVMVIVLLFQAARERQDRRATHE